MLLFQPFLCLFISPRHFPFYIIVYFVGLLVYFCLTFTSVSQVESWFLKLSGRQSVLPVLLQVEVQHVQETWNANDTLDCIKRRLSRKSGEVCIQLWGPQHKNNVGLLWRQTERSEKEKKINIWK